MMSATLPLPHSWAACPDWARQTLDRILQNKATALDQLWAHPDRVMTSAGMTPDRWQEGLLRSTSRRLLLLTCRQGGKTETAAALALHTALIQPKALLLLLSPSERQSGELAMKVNNFFEGLGKPIPPTKWTALQLHLANATPITASPESEKTIRGYSGAS